MSLKLILIIGLVLSGFIVAPVVACVEVVELPNGDICVLNDNTGNWQYFSHITGKWTTNSNKRIASTNATPPTMYPTGSVSAGDINSYSNSFVQPPQINVNYQEFLPKTNSITKSVASQRFLMIK